jgi:hypothetical protein
MKRKILLFLVLFMAVTAFKCPIKPNNDPCSLSCNSGSTYDVIYTNPNCPGREIDNVLCIVPFPGITYKTDCQGTCAARLFQHQFFHFFLTANPSGVDLNALPASITISGQAMDATYGMPRVDYYDDDGYLVGSVYATQASGDGSWLVAPTPDLSQAWSGNYQVRVTNMTWEGRYMDEVGTADLNCWGRDRPDSDGDGWYDDEDCYPYDSSRWDCADPCYYYYNQADTQQMERPACDENLY